MYETLISKPLAAIEFEQLDQFIKQAKRENNQEYVYLGYILQLDYFIELGRLDDTLDSALKILQKMDSELYPSFYVGLLDRIIYVYIQRKNFKAAYRYVFRKRNHINLDDNASVNRWYLEMSYVYAELNEKSRALLNLQAILENHPSPELQSLALSNMTKLYIDQNMIEEAKKTLNLCLEIVMDMNDTEGKLYCDYLLAKIYMLEKNYRFAKDIFDDIFKNENVLLPGYLNIVNEYLELLIQMNLFSQAGKVIAKYEKHFFQSDVFLKKDFYKNILKVSIYKNQNLKTELEQVLHILDDLEKEIQENNEEILNEAADDEKKEEVTSHLRQSVFQIERIIDTLTKFDIHLEERETIQDFSKKLELETEKFEALYVVLNRYQASDLPTFMDQINKVNSFQYKNERLYAREHTFNDLNHTIIEHIIQEEQEIAIDFKDDQVELKDIVTNKTYTSLGFKTLLGFPLFLDNELFGCAIFVSENDLTEDKNYIVLKIAAKILEFRLSTIYFQDTLRTHKNILQVAINRLQEGIFYFETKKGRFSLSDRLAQYLQLEKYSITKDEYLALIHPADKNHYHNVLMTALESSNPYEISYRISVSDTYKRVKETADPFITKEGDVNFYIGSLQELEEVMDVNPSSMPYQDYTHFLDHLKNLKKQSANIEFKFSFIRVVINNLFDLEPSANEVLAFVSNVFLNELSISGDEIHRLTDNTLIVTLPNTIDKRTLLRYVNTISRVIKDKGKQNYRFRDIDAKFVITRYPRDGVSVEDVFEFTDKGVSYASSDEIVFFDNEMYQKHLEQLHIQNATIRFMKEAAPELLYQQMKKGSATFGYLVGYNVKGIINHKQIRENLDKTELINFEEYILQAVLDHVETIPFPVFMKISAFALENMVNRKQLQLLHKNKQIKFIIDRSNLPTSELSRLIHALRDLGFSVGVVYPLLETLSVSILSEKIIDFIDIENHILDKYHRIFKLFEVFEINLLSSKAISFYENSIVYDGDYVTKAFLVGEKQ